MSLFTSRKYHKILTGSLLLFACYKFYYSPYGSSVLSWVKKKKDIFLGKKEILAPDLDEDFFSDNNIYFLEEVSSFSSENSSNYELLDNNNFIDEDDNFI